jgi:hypothetical protein
MGSASKIIYASILLPTYLSNNANGINVGKMEASVNMWLLFMVENARAVIRGGEGSQPFTTFLQHCTDCTGHTVSGSCFCWSLHQLWLSTKLVGKHVGWGWRDGNYPWSPVQEFIEARPPETVQTWCPRHVEQEVEGAVLCNSAHTECHNLPSIKPEQLQLCRWY